MSKNMNTTKKTIALFWHHASRYPAFLVPLLIFVPIVAVAGSFLQPLILSDVLEKISQKSYDPSNMWGSFGWDIISYSLLALFTAVIGWRIVVWLIWTLELKVIRDMSQRVFEHLINMSANFHANRFGGSIVSQATKLNGAYVRFADATIFEVYFLLISLIATVIILAPRAPFYTLALIILSAIYLTGVILLSKPVRKVNVLEAQAQSKQTGLLADNITNVMAIKSFATTHQESQRFWQSSGEVLSAGKQNIRMTTMRDLFGSTVTNSLSVAALILAVVAVGTTGIDISTIFLMVSYTTMLSKSLWDFQNVLRRYNKAFGDASDMVEILQIAPEVKDPKSPETCHIKEGHIEFKDMTFTHADAAQDDALFSKVNMNIKPGEKIGLVGHSGSGKTTLTRLLLRFSDLDAGQILIDSQDIAKIKQNDLRQAISYVPQEPLLFHRSIAENIAYGKPDATKQEIQEAARKAHAEEFINRLPNGYETLVGERGVKLSGGQRQRVAIARAILKDAPILVLDEATSALDSESERLIQAALGELMKNRTAIVIAHRLSTVQKMDRIIVLENGQIKEQGSHAELLKLGGEYAKLWAHQSGGFIED